MKISHILINQVVVPARPDSVNSPELDRPLHQLSFAGQRGFSVQFDAMPKPILRLYTDEGIIGLGECYRGILLEQLLPIARSLLGCDLRALNIQDLPIPAGRLYDGFECAILDALGKALKIPVYLLLGGRYRDRVECSYWTGHRTVDDAARKAKEAHDQGFTTIKFKCDLDDPVVAWCQAIYDECGSDFRVVLDPNGRWQSVANTLQRSESLHQIGNVLCLEDPLPRWNFREYHLLRNRCSLPIAIHVSLPYLELGQMPTDVIQGICCSGCDYFNFNGGCFPVKRLAAAADLADIPFWHGSEVDLGILEASYVHKASACSNCTLPSDIFGRLVREHDLLKQPLQFDGPFVCVSSAPGLGIELDSDALANYSISEHEVSP